MPKGVCSYKYSMELYPLELHLYFNADMEDFLDRYDVIDASGNRITARKNSKARKAFLNKAKCCSVITTGAVEKTTGKYAVCIIMDVIDIPVWAHESDHAADFICDFCGVRYGSFQTGEAHAYLVELVMRKIVDSYFEMKGEEKL